MLECVAYRSGRLIRAERRDGALVLYLEDGVQMLVPVNERSLRVLYAKRTGDSAQDDLVEFLSKREQETVAGLKRYEEWSYTEDGKYLTLQMPQLRVQIDKRSNRFVYYDGQGRQLLAEREERSKELAEFPVYRMDEHGIRKETVETADGCKEVVREAGRIQTGTAYHTRVHFVFEEKEALYGLGQQEEGYASLRGERVYLHQGNRKIAIPMMVSTKGYGLFFPTGGPAVFNDTIEGSYFYTEADTALDFFFMNGREVQIPAMDAVIREFRKITGKAAMLPKWAFGYIQSQERYETAAEILEVVKECRERRIGLDCIVLDWSSWPEGQWGQKEFDPARFPDPSGMIRKLHEEHVHFMISIWPNFSGTAGNELELRENGQMLPGLNVYNALSEKARKIYWQQAQRGLFCHGVDAWWCDNSEPFTPEWNEMVRPENSRNYEEYCRSAFQHLPAEKSNLYGFYHAQGIYEGQRAYYIREIAEGRMEPGKEKRVFNLTRSGSAGQQRFGAVLWSGDISASWDTLRRQISAGTHLCASGMPYWTVDIGAFFVKNGAPWYWDGKYDQGPENPGYCELFVRWYQWGAFLPLFRVHGTDFRRELWQFDKPQAPFYEALLKANRTRYELIPYLYSLAGKVWREDALMMKPLAFGYPDDETVQRITDQYLLGDALMVCPVTEAMYFDADGKRMENDRFVRKVYLPGNAVWYDFWTGEACAGGGWIDAPATLDRIPVYIKAGSILTVTESADSTEQQTEKITVRIYPGQDGSFTLYEDAGDGYGYEKGEYVLTELMWDDLSGKLLVNGKENVRFRVEIFKKS
ncbi:MAG: DUF5110 domain-containing protein [Lachnospiraceae bacterium]|nr:DUF5110 domain-containing protein [Lachnospiraceae bacterium]